ncbi:hypothetical protein E2C01_080476 [Portunus trituberculatus]|uniref:Uncharacterized protein n=1 Tax=Portunus trituberculatus TaxID=210409 RepID=A0A5B7IPC5_PORTR|nr:hypothetical protein [Portunus trituberculatus]
MLFQTTGVLGVHRVTEVNTNTMQVQGSSVRYWQLREGSGMDGVQKEGGDGNMSGSGEVGRG